MGRYLFVVFIGKNNAVFTAGQNDRLINVRIRHKIIYPRICMSMKLAKLKIFEVNPIASRARPRQAATHDLHSDDHVAAS